MTESSAARRLSDIRMEYSTLALGVDEDEGFKLILKQVNRSRFFLQEAVDQLPEPVKEEAGLQGTNLLLELTRAELLAVFAEQRRVLTKLMELLKIDALPSEERDKLAANLSDYTETLAKLHGLTQVHLLKRELDPGYNG